MAPISSKRVRVLLLNSKALIIIFRPLIFYDCHEEETRPLYSMRHAWPAFILKNYVMLNHNFVHLPTITNS